MFKTLSGFLNNLNIGQRLSVGFGILVILTLLVGGVSFVTTESKNQAFDRVQVTQLGIDLSQNINIELQKARGYRQDFLLRWRSEGFQAAYDNYVIQSREHTQNARDLIGQIRLIKDEAEVLELLDQTEETINALDEGFEQILGGIQTRGFVDTGLEGQMRDAAHALEESPTLTDPANASLLVTLLQMRRREKDYFLRGDQEYVQNTLALTTRLHNQVLALSIPTADKGVLIGQIEAYTTNFNALVEQERQITQDINEFQAVGESIEPVLETIIENETEESGAALADYRTIEQVAAWSNIILLGLAVVAGGVLAFIIRRSIVRPLAELTDTAAHLSGGELNRRAVITSRDETGVLARVFNVMAQQLDDIVAGLEITVAERTLELAITVQVGTLATSIRSQQELLPTIVEFIHGKFELYYTQVYLLDETKRYALLRAGTGTVGEQLLARGHQLELNGKSLVATAAQTGAPVLVSDTETSPIHKKNLLLPDTRSEVAIPLLVGDEILGVLDMQATEVGKFNSDNQPVFQAMANQLAAALSSARAYDEAQAAIARAEDINRRLTSETWEPYLEGLEDGRPVGYQYDLESPKPLQEALLDAGEAAMCRPVSLRGQQIGTLVVKDDEEREWLPEEQRLVANVAERVARALEQFRAFDQVKQSEAQTQQRALELEIVANVSAAAASVLDLDGLLLGVVELTTDSFELYHTQIYLLDEVGENLLLAAGAGEAGRLMKARGHSIPVSHEHSLVARAARTLDGVVANDVTQEPDFLPNPLLPETRSELSVPLAAGGILIGVLDTQADTPNRFAESDVRVYTTLADQIAVAAQNARAFTQIQQRAMELEIVANVSAAASSILEVDPLLQGVADLTKEGFGLYHAHIYLLDEAGEYLALAAGAGEPGRLMLERGHSIPLNREHSLVARAARTRKGVTVGDVTQEPDFLPNALLPDTRSEVAIPLVVGSELLGVLDMQDSAFNRFAEADVRVLGTLADQIAIAIQNARAFKAQQETAERLREVDRLKSQFLANMSHELRTPLNSIIGYSEVLLDGGDGDLSGEAVEDIQTIHGSGQHLLALINDILDLAKIEAGQMQVSRQEADLPKFLGEIIHAGEILVKDKPVSLVLVKESEIPAVYADPVRLRQIVWNLISNAVKFTEEGSVTVAVGMMDEQVAYVKVTDSGIGIKSEHLNLVFEQFRQVDGSSTRRAGGTGLGLTITRHLVRLHGGEIYVESEFGVGSTFWFTLPIYVPQNA